MRRARGRCSHEELRRGSPKATNQRRKGKEMEARVSGLAALKARGGVRLAVPCPPVAMLAQPAADCPPPRLANGRARKHGGLEEAGVVADRWVWAREKKKKKFDFKI